jgi:hypothetical protein
LVKENYWDAGAKRRQSLNEIVGMPEQSDGNPNSLRQRQEFDFERLW